jgi:P-type Cu2+ transporter
MNFETITLQVKDYISPECTCKVEDIVNVLPHVVESSFDPINGLLKVKVHKGMTSAKEIIDKLKKCPVNCEQPHSMAKGPKGHMKNEAMKMSMTMGAQKPAMHDHHAMMEAEFKRSFIIAAIFTIPVLILSPSIQAWIGYTLPLSFYLNLILAIAASIVILYGGLVFYKGSIQSFKMHTLDMNVLVSIALLAGYLYSLAATFLFKAPDFYWEISTLATFILFGHWMEMRAQRSASGALKELVKLIPPTANLIKGENVSEVPTSELKVDDIVLVRPGEKVPIDGIVVEGETSINESMVTGESKPVSKKKDSTVLGGTINAEGAIRFRVTKTGEDTAIAQIIKLVEQAITSKPKVQKLADRAAFYLTLIAIFVGAGTFIFWYGVGAGILFALSLSITVIVITCPHALGLAIPAVTSISTTMAANNGMLIKNADALEIAKKIDVVMFDKTGTLTKGEFGVTDIVVLGNWDEKRLLQAAAAVEINSEHVIAKAIVKKAFEEGLASKVATQFASIPGKGAKALVDNEEVYLGNANLLKEFNLSLTEESEKVFSLSSQGKTVVYFLGKNKLLGLIAMADLIRDESREAIKSLKASGLEVAMITGDNKQTAAYVANELGLTTFFAEVLPDQKANTVKSVQDKGKRVAMVGDGINDAPALVQADVGIAIGAGTDVAIESADVVLIRNDPRDVAKLITLSKKTMRKMNENLAWATGYNVIAIPAAAGVLVPLGIVIPPEFAAITMSLSSISVIINALLLKRAKI